MEGKGRWEGKREGEEVRKGKWRVGRGNRCDEGRCTSYRCPPSTCSPAAQTESNRQTGLVSGTSRTF